MASKRKSGTYRLQRRKGSIERAPRHLQMEIYDYDDEEDANRKHTRKSCGGKGASCAPTPFPSIAPSPFPTRSLAPSSHPSEFPSTLPTESPSGLPSFGPTASPMPSKQPSSVPSFSPSTRPSDRPTNDPSSFPSSEPTFSTMPSSHPTSGPVKYLPSEGTDDLVSFCEEQPPESSGVSQKQTLAFQYNLYITLDANFEQELANIETDMHARFSQEFLICDYGTDEPFYILSINAAPDDSLNDASCDTTNDPTPARESKCALVTAEMTMMAYFPNRRILQITTANPAVLTIALDFLQSSMKDGQYETAEIVQATFQGFLNSQDGSRETPPGDVAGIIGNESQPSNVTEKPIALGGAVVGLAALILVLILFVEGHRRKRRRETYLKHLNDMSEEDYDGGSEEQKNSGALGDERVHIVIDDNDFNNVCRESSSPSAILRDLDATQVNKYDVHVCNSATCPVCRNQRIDPIFLRNIVMDRERLRAVAAIRNSHRSPDTVEL